MSNTSIQKHISLTMAIVHTILGIGASIWLVYSMAHYKEEEHHEKIAAAKCPNRTEEKHLGLTGLILWFLFSITIAIFAVLLLIGILTERPKLMIPFVYGTLTMIAAMLMYGVIVFLWDLFSNLLNGLMFLLTAFFFWPVYGHFQDVEEKLKLATENGDKESKSSKNSNTDDKSSSATDID